MCQSSLPGCVTAEVAESVISGLVANEDDCKDGEVDVTPGKGGLPGPFA